MWGVCGWGYPLANSALAPLLLCRLLGNGKCHEMQVLFVVKLTIDDLGPFQGFIESFYRCLALFRQGCPEIGNVIADAGLTDFRIGQQHNEHGAAGGSGFHFDGATVGTDQFCGNRQPKAGSSGIC